jgi:hypothetical protein
MRKLLIVMAVCAALAPEAFAQIVNYHYKNEQHVYSGGHERVINRFPDSVRIEIPEKSIIIVLQASNYSATLAAFKEIERTMKDLSKTIADSYTGDNASAHVVRQWKDLNDHTHIDITENETYGARVLSKDHQLMEVLPGGWEFFVEEARYRLYVYADEPGRLAAVNEMEILQVVEKLTASRNFRGGRKSVKARFIVREGTLAFSDVRYHQPLDMVSLSLSGSVGVLRNRIYPEITGNLGFYIADRFNRQSHRIELSYNTMYFAERTEQNGFQSNISPFVGISYSKNLGKTGANWYGVGAAYLLKQSGEYDFFNGKTMKLFFTSTIADGAFSMIPEFYFTNDFKTTQFGMKLQYRF